MEVVTGVGYCVDLKFGKGEAARSYRLRALTVGEAGRLTEMAMGHYRPSDAVINEEVRQALERASHLDKIDVLDEFEAAQDAYQSALSDAYGDNEEPERRAAIATARKALMAAKRKRDVAEYLVRTDKELVALRLEAHRADVIERLETLSLALVSWDGAALPAWQDAPSPELISQVMPEGDQKALYAKVLDMTSPSLEVMGNSEAPSKS
jgi:hypothetical protein